MRNWLPAVTILGALACCSAVRAQSSNPSTATLPGQTAAEVLTGISTQTREEQIGETRLYTSETRVTAPGLNSENTQSFALETVAMTRNKLVMRYRLISATASDASRPYLSGLLQSYVDVPIEFEASLSGMPQKIINWTRVSQALEANMARNLPEEEALRAGTLAGLNAMTDNARALAILSDVATLAQMQPRGPVRQGRFTAPEARAPLQDGRFAVTTRFAELDMIDPARCTARFQSGTSTQIEGGSERTGTTLTGELSTMDGWANTLESVAETVVPAGAQSKTLTIRRDGSPGCG